MACPCAQHTPFSLTPRFLLHSHPMNPDQFLNGTPVILEGRAQALAHYPHARIVNGMIYVSGISSRRLDNT